MPDEAEVVALGTGLVGEHLVQLDAIELTVGVLLDRAHSLVAGPLSHVRLPVGRTVNLGFKRLMDICQLS